MGKQKMKSKQVRVDLDLFERFNRVNDVLAANGSEVIRRLMEAYVIKKEEELKVKVETILEMKENFPNDGEAYAVGKANNLYFYAWGPEYPYADNVPSYDIPDGDSGISWHNTKKEALATMNEAVEARNN
ncbi:hypothetical protein V6C20_09260 [Caldibacillus thermoamylovorans]